MANTGDPVSISDFVVLDAESAGSLSRDLQGLLHAIRSHLGMEVAFVSEFKDGRRVFRSVDAANGSAPVRVGGADPLEQSYCHSVITGKLPELIPDTAAVPATRAFAATRALPVGSHLSVPIRLEDGRVYGTFCCFSSAPDSSLNARDLNMMRVFADLAAQRIERDLDAADERQNMEQRIDLALRGDAVSTVYQPIFDLESAAVGGFEALSRFTLPPARSPDVWFNEAAIVGRGVELELKAAERALAGLESLPRDTYVSVNLSPDSAARGGIARVLESMPLDRVVLEVTEHAVVSQYADLETALAPLRDKGVRVAVDDAGAGYSSFRHILQLKPDLIKLDTSLTRDVDKDPGRRALAVALIAFGRDTGSQIVAEGVETAAELRALRALGVSKVQGYYLGRPVPLATAQEFCAPGRPLKSGFH